MYNSQLLSFLCVADCGSFTKASEKLFISATSIMKQINSLENHLNLKLFLRSNQGVRLTEAGKVIYRHAKSMVEYSERAVEEARQAMMVEESTFCVGTSILNPCRPFMELWYQVERNFPGYKLHIVPFEDDHEGILSEISALGEKFDFLVGACDSEQWLDRCSFLKLGEYQHCVAVPEDHRLADRKRLEISDLFGETILMVKRGDSSVVDCIRTELAQHPQIKIEDAPQFYDMQVFNRCAQTGYVMLTLDCWKDVHPTLVTIPMDWAYPLPYGLMYAKDPSPDVSRFIDAVKGLQ